MYEIKDETDFEKWGAVSGISNNDWNAVKIITVANGWRLPTQQEWEFAAKGGMRSQGYTGIGADNYYGRISSLASGSS